MPKGLPDELLTPEQLSKRQKNRASHQKFMAKNGDEWNAHRRELYAQNPEYYKNFTRKWKADNPTYHQDYMKEYNKTHPNFNKHRTKKVGNAQGEAVKKTKLGVYCELCPDDDKRFAEERHHPDYDYPLYFVSVCRSCHKYVHFSQVETTSNANLIVIYAQSKTEVKA